MQIYVIQPSFAHNFQDHVRRIGILDNFQYREQHFLCGIESPLENQERKSERDFLTEVRLHVEASRHRGYVATFPPITRPWKAHMQICQADHAANLRQNIRTLGGTFLGGKLYTEQIRILSLLYFSFSFFPNKQNLDIPGVDLYSRSPRIQFLPSFSRKRIPERSQNLSIMH